ncbi:MAG: hypothetical protein GY874_11650 [Desulfobacteraceae bacterium]|nr:hypothetical protein [Desulfobacteraceae bacterium]
MVSQFKLIIIAAITLTMILAPCSVWANNENVLTSSEQIKIAEMTTDAIVVRPLGAVATVTGLVVFVVALPFAALGGNTKSTFKTLVANPAVFTFKRPIGGFE